MMLMADTQTSEVTTSALVGHQSPMTQEDSIQFRDQSMRQATELLEVLSTQAFE
jgi:hypothetical protein